MKPENPDEALLERGLAAWDVPEPPPDLADRILAQNAETLTALSTPPNPSPTPAELQPLEEDRPAMLPTTIRNESSMRPFWTATALGFAAAAAIVLAFMAGRQSSTPPLTPGVPNVEIQVTAPAPVAQPPVPPAPPEPPALPKNGTTDVLEVPDSSGDPVPAPPRVPRGPISPDLKNPFDSGKSRSRSTRGVEPPAKDPFASDKTPSAVFPDLADPFATGVATLRLGTKPGSPPAKVSVDGKPVGTTPIVALKVSPGTHTVSFKWPGKRYSITVDVEADESKTIRPEDL